MDIYSGKIKVKLTPKEKRLAKKLEVELTKVMNGGSSYIGRLWQKYTNQEYYNKKMEMRARIKELIKKYKTKNYGYKGDVSPKNCELIISYPQYSGTCWFNVIIMSMFYSQYCRPLMINHINYLKSKSEDLYDMFSYVIFYNFLKDEKYNDEGFQDIFKPEDILRALRDYDKKKFIFN